MLENSFLHFSGVSKLAEKALWLRGITDWNLLETHLPLELDLGSVGLIYLGTEIREQIIDSREALLAGNAGYFWNLLPYDQTWRIYASLPRSFWALDIETTGLGHSHRVTSICVTNGEVLRQFVRTKNLDEFYDFWEAKSNDILLTYNGVQFDIPFIEKTMDWKNLLPHLDLMHVLHKMGIKGGLKGSEEQLGIRRKDSISKMGGYEAVILWNRYVETDKEEYLDLLLEYNREDTTNLHKILEIVCERKRREIFPLQPGLFP